MCERHFNGCELLSAQPDTTWRGTNALEHGCLDYANIITKSSVGRGSPQPMAMRAEQSESGAAVRSGCLYIYIYRHVSRQPSLVYIDPPFLWAIGAPISAGLHCNEHYTWFWKATKNVILRREAVFWHVNEWVSLYILIAISHGVIINLTITPWNIRIRCRGTQHDS